MRRSRTGSARYATDHAGKEDGPPQTLMVRAWLNPDGTVERVSFDTLKDARADVDLRPILTRGNFGKAGPVSAEVRRGPAWIFCVYEENQQRQYRPRDGKAHAP